MRSLNLDQLRTLVTIADLGTFAAAAQALHLAQPTVSLHVSELELRLGTGLLQRGGRRAVPTEAGAALIERGRRLLREADEAIDAVRRHAEGRAGKVRLGTSTGVVVHILPQVLQALASQHPGIDVEVSILGSHETLARLQAGTLQLGLVALPQPPQPGLVVVPLRADPMVAFLPTSWDAPEVVTPAWLADKPLIFNDASTRMYRLTMAWFGAAGFTPSARIELNFTEAMKSLVMAGYGAAVLPLEHPPEQAALDKLQLRPLAPPLVRELGLVHPPVSALDAATRHVLDTLSRFGPGLAGGLLNPGVAGNAG